VQLLTITIAANFDDVTATPEALAAFVADFSSGLSAALGVDASRIKVIGVSPGSVVVDFIIVNPQGSSSAEQNHDGTGSVSGPSVEELVQQFTEAKQSGVLASVGSYQSLPDPSPLGAQSVTPGPPRRSSPAPPPAEEESSNVGFGLMVLLVMAGAGGGIVYQKKFGGESKVDFDPKKGVGNEDKGFRDSIDLEENQEQTDNPLSPDVASDAASAASAAANAAIAASAAAAAAAQAAAHAATFGLQNSGGNDENQDNVVEQDHHPVADCDDGGVSNPLAGTVAFDVEESSRPSINDGELCEAAAPGATFDVEDAVPARANKKRGKLGLKMGGKSANMIRGIGPTLHLFHTFL
jgi:hypothetical protein